MTAMRAEEQPAEPGQKLALFTLSSARSGTLYLRYLFQNNIRNCVCRHEPFFDWGNPTFFGRAIYDAHAGRLDRLRQLMAAKRSYVERLPGRVYLESSHAFLKSAYRVALEFFPNLGLIHLIRDPLKVARSQAWREGWRRRLHAPFHFYRGDDGDRHFAWALTRNEEIFRAFEGERLTLFQLYLLEWIEIENRAVRFLLEHDLQNRCFTLQTPRELNEPVRIAQLFDFFGLERKGLELVQGGRKNRSLGYSNQGAAVEEAQCAEVLARVPSQYLDIFSHPPYVGQKWSQRLVPARSGGVL